MPSKKSNTLSPVPVAGFMPPPPRANASNNKKINNNNKKAATKATASTASSSKFKPKPIPTKTEAAKNIAMVGKSLLKLSRQLQGS